MDINIRAFGGEIQALLLQLQPGPERHHPGSDTRPGFRNSTLGGATPVDPDLKGQYIDEYLVGYEYEVSRTSRSASRAPTASSAA